MVSLPLDPEELAVAVTPAERPWGFPVGRQKVEAMDPSTKALL